MVIGIGGVSRSGKTELAKLIKSKLNDHKVIILSQDEYAYPIDKIPLIHNVTDWETYNSIDFGLLSDDIKSAKKEYEYIIVEGFLAFHDANLTGLYDRSIFLEIEKPVFENRRKLDNRWEEEPEWYLDHVWCSYLKYGQMPDIQNVLTISGEGIVPINLVMAHIAVTIDLL